MGGSTLIFPHSVGDSGRNWPRPTRQERAVFMQAPIPADDRTPRVSRVVAEALVRRQGPRRIVTRATRLGLPTTLTRALVVACGASALDVASLPARRR
jgi:hypothetical protein